MVHICRYVSLGRQSALPTGPDHTFAQVAVLHPVARKEHQHSLNS